MLIQLYNLWKDILNKRKEQDGAVAVIVALLMAALIGMAALVIDLGNSYVAASKLQNGLDSAALAAVQELPAAHISDPKWQNTKTVGTEYAVANGLSGATFEPVVKNGKIRGVIVKGTVDVTYTLAQVLGFQSGEVIRAASAEVQTVDGMTDLMPMAATVESMEKLLEDGEDTIYLKGGPQGKDFFGDNGGWRGFWSTEKGNFDVDGYEDMVRVGDVIKTKNGVSANAADEIYENRVSGHESCTLENYKEVCAAAPNCSRIVMVPIVQILSNQDLIVRGFASFFIETAEKDKGKIKSIEATYINNIVISGFVSGGAANDYGVYAWKLTD